MSLLRLFVFISILDGLVECQAYRHCDSHLTFCIFSFGPNTTVKDVAEAEDICTNAKRGSWVYNTTDTSTQYPLIEFFGKFPFPDKAKVILSDEGKDGDEIAYVWLHDKADGTQFSDFRKVDKIKLKQNPKPFAVVCAIGCYSGWEIINNSQYEDGDHNEDISIQECQQKCETKGCEAFEWDSTEGCFIHNQITGDRKENPDRTLHIIKRTEKTVDKCIGDLTASTNILNKKTTQSVHGDLTQSVHGDLTQSVHGDLTASTNIFNEKTTQSMGGGGLGGFWVIPVSLLLTIIIVM